MATSTLHDRLKRVEEAEQEIYKAVEAAQTFVTHLATDKKTSRPTMDGHQKQFTESLNNAERILAEQIDYLSNVCVGTPHEGSVFCQEQQRRLAELRKSLVLTSLKEHSKVLTKSPTEPAATNGCGDSAESVDE